MHLLFLIGVLLCSTTLASIGCIGDGGASVDWWFMLKLPDVVGDYKGYTYVYIDSNSTGTFKTGDLHDATNPLALTVYQLGLYGHSVDKSSIGYVLWNDQTYETLSGKAIDHEQDTNGIYYAHSKASIAFDATQGFWLAHSAPGFPYQHPISPSSWSFPTSQSIYAQHFFCVSISTSLINKISSFLLNYHAFIYDFNVPTGISGLEDFSNFVNGKFTTSEGTIRFKSIGGVDFVGFGKHGLTQSDIYEDYVAPGLDSGGLLVQSWCCGDYGDCCMTSYCKGQTIVDPSNPQKSQSTYTYNSIDIEKMSFASNLYYSKEYNHAKFAITQTGSYVCPSDNNRALTQRNRGGGSLCFKDATLYSFLYQHVSGVNTTCTKFNEVV